MEHEALAKRYDQAIAQVRLLQHNKEQDRQDIEGRYIDSLKRCVCAGIYAYVCLNGRRCMCVHVCMYARVCVCVCVFVRSLSHNINCSV